MRTTTHMSNLPPEFYAKLAEARLLGHDDLHVNQIKNKFGNVGRKEMQGNYAAFEIIRCAPLRQVEPACKELKIPYAYYVQGWSRLRGVEGLKWKPQLQAVVVRRDHAEQLRLHLKGHIEQQDELELKLSPAVRAL